MTVPVGLPAHTRTATIEHYGGHPNKRDFMSEGSIDPRTDVDAAMIQRMAADLAAVVRVAPLATLSYTTSDSSPADPTVHFACLQSGVTASYAGGTPPAGFPAVTRLADGAVYITFETTLADDFGVTAPVHCQGASGSTEVQGTNVYWAVTDPNVDTYNERVQVSVADSTPSAVQDVTVFVRIWG